MKGLPYLDAAGVELALSMPDAIASARLAFRAMRDGSLHAPPRLVLRVSEESTTLVMAAANTDGTVQKTVSVVPGNPSRGLPTTLGLLTFYDAKTLEPRFSCDAGALTAMRTGAASGLATELLAADRIDQALVIGGGAQARTQAMALLCTRQPETLVVWARRTAQAEALASSLARDPRSQGTTVRAAKADLAQEVAASRLIALATSASQPILQGEWLRPGTHINAVGSFRPDLREFDRATVERAELWVDLREAAEEEAGELIEAAKAGALQWSRCRELGELLDEPPSPPTQSNSDRITLFKSVGHAAQDLYAALAISRLRNANDSAGP